jgi:hypothetical protein
MPDLNSTLERCLYCPIRQSFGRSAKAGRIRVWRNSVFQRMAAGAIRLSKSPAISRTFRKSVRIAIGHARRDEERRCKDE